MATAQPKFAAPKESTTSNTASRKPAQDAFALLKSDHAEVKKCFEAYEKLVKTDASAEERQTLANEICNMLNVHAQIEEEIFYPASRELLGDDVDLLDEAGIEHASAKALIAQIQSGNPDDKHFSALVKVLSEYIEHHVKQEEDELFSTVKEAGLDTKAIGQELLARKEELMGEITA